MLTPAFPGQTLLKRFFAATAVAQEKGGFLGMMQRVFENLCHDLINRAAHVDSELGVIQKISPFQKGFVNDRSLFIIVINRSPVNPFCINQKGV